MRATALGSILLSACLMLTGCRRSHRNVRIGKARSTSFVVAPASGSSSKVGEGRYLVGALRVELGRSAPAPYPASTLIAAADVEGGWLFAAEDGALFRAKTFLGPLVSIGALAARGNDSNVTVTSHGALVVVDERRRVQIVDARGSIRTLPMRDALSAVMLGATELLVIREPGVLEVSSDGGSTFRNVPIGRGLPTLIRTWSGTMIHTTDTIYQWSDGRLVELPGPPVITQDEWVPGVVSEVRAQTSILPADQRQAAARPDGSIVSLQGNTLVLFDPKTRREILRRPAPGTACTLASSSAGLRATCMRGSARVAFAEEPAPTPLASFRAIRDEASGAPMGPIVFDDSTSAFFVDAACVPGSAVKACFIDADGLRPVSVPFDAVPVAMHAGVALLVETKQTDRSTRALLVRGSSVLAIELPISSESARRGRFARGGLSFVATTEAGTDLITVTLDGVATRTRAPLGTTFAIEAVDGSVIAFGEAADVLHRAADGRTFLAMSSPVSGSAASLPLRGPSYCVGSWCKIGFALEWSPTSTSAVPPALARVAAVSARVSLKPPKLIRCAFGETSPALGLDRGAAAPGWSIVVDEDGTKLKSTVFVGLDKEITSTFESPGRPGSTIAVRPALLSDAPAAMVDRCVIADCDHLFIAPGALSRLPSTSALDGRLTDYFSDPLGHLLTITVFRDSIVRQDLVRLGATGLALSSGSRVMRHGRHELAVGVLDGRDGSFVFDTDTRLRFVPLQGVAKEESFPMLSASTAVCTAPPSAARGYLRLRYYVSPIQADAWRPTAGAYRHEEELRIVGTDTCIGARAAAQVAGEAAKDPESKVRSFVVRAGTDGALVGLAWGGGEKRALRCTLDR